VRWGFWMTRAKTERVVAAEGEAAVTAEDVGVQKEDGRLEGGTTA
jgi:hypothetical protein